MRGRVDTEQGFTLVELLISMGVLAILMGLIATFLRNSNSDARERNEIDALASLITNATRQASAINANLVLDVGTSARVLQCTSAACATTTPLANLTPIELTGLTLPKGRALGFRSDGVVAFSGQMANLFGNLQWTPGVTAAGSGQQFRLNITRYGDVVSCDAAAHPTNCPAEVTR